MKNILRTFFFALITSIIIGLNSCTETSGNGDLDGMWHLISIDTLSTSSSRDFSHDYIYWSFSFRLLEVDDKTNSHQSVLLRFEHIDQNLRLYEPYLYNRETGDEPIEDISYLLPFGIEALDITYNIEILTSSRMIISSPNLRLSFRKF